jgi:hypothetical protein
MEKNPIKFYMKDGRWKVTASKKPVNAQAWWTAINEVKCLNHKLRMKERNEQDQSHGAATRQSD